MRVVDSEAIRDTHGLHALLALDRGPFLPFRNFPPSGLPFSNTTHETNLWLHTASRVMRNFLWQVLPSKPIDTDCASCILFTEIAYQVSSIRLFNELLGENCPKFIVLQLLLLPQTSCSR